MTPRKAEARAFLEGLASGLSVTGAAKAAGVARRTVYDWRERDAAFRAEWDAALDAGTEVLEDEARRRAVEGTVKPIYQGGVRVDNGEVREYSDVLLIFLLKGRKPEKYRDNVKVDTTASISVNHSAMIEAAHNGGFRRTNRLRDAMGDESPQSGQN